MHQIQGNFEFAVHSFDSNLLDPRENTSSDTIELFHTLDWEFLITCVWRQSELIRQITIQSSSIDQDTKAVAEKALIDSLTTIELDCIN